MGGPTTLTSAALSAVPQSPPPIGIAQSPPPIPAAALAASNPSPSVSTSFFRHEKGFTIGFVSPDLRPSDCAKPPVEQFIQTQFTSWKLNDEQKGVYTFVHTKNNSRFFYVIVEAAHGIFFEQFQVEHDDDCESVFEGTVELYSCKKLPYPGRKLDASLESPLDLKDDEKRINELCEKVNFAFQHHNVQNDVDPREYHLYAGQLVSNNNYHFEYRLRVCKKTDPFKPLSEKEMFKNVIKDIVVKKG